MQRCSRARYTVVYVKLILSSLPVWHVNSGCVHDKRQKDTNELSKCQGTASYISIHINQGCSRQDALVPDWCDNNKFCSARTKYSRTTLTPTIYRLTTNVPMCNTLCGQQCLLAVETCFCLCTVGEQLSLDTNCAKDQLQLV